jgi:superkiller protein 3
VKARLALAMLITTQLLAARGAAVQETPRGSAQRRDNPRSANREPANPRPDTPRPAIAELERAVERAPRDARRLLALGLAYWDGNDYPRALEIFQRTVVVAPTSAEAHNWLGVALAEKADLVNAIAMLNKAIALDPGYGRAYANLGSALAAKGDLVEAVAVFRKALALEPDSLAAHLNLGLALRDTGDLSGALVHLRRVAAGDPENPAIHYELGQTLRQNDDLIGAVAAFERALGLDPERRDAYYALGVALKQQSALTAPTRPGAASAGDDAYVRAREAAARGDLAAARDHATEAIRRDDAHAEAHNLLGFVLGQQGDLAAAVRELERAIVLRPESADAHYNLGVALWYHGARERSLSELRESVRLDPAAGASHAFLGIALRESGQLPAARVSLQRAIALLPPTAATYVDLGIVFLRTNEPVKALGQFEAGLNVPVPSLPAPDWDAAIAGLKAALAAPAALAAGDDRADAHHVLGRMLGRKGAETSAVIAELRAAVRLRPGSAEMHNTLGLVLIQAADDAAGIASLREAVRLAPEYAEARANLGAALTPTDPDAAVRELERAVALAPASVNAQFNLAVAYGASSAQGVAREIEQLRKVIGLSPTFARAHLALGKALMRDGQIPEAIAELEEAARLEPKSGEAHYQLGLALARAGRKDEAAASLAKGRALVAEDDKTQNAVLDIAEGQAAFDRGALDEAEARFRRALKLRPDSREAQRYLDTIAARRRGTSDDPARVTAVEAHIRQGQFKEVEPLLADYVKERPSSSWAWYALGYSLFAQQRIGESIKALAKSLELDVTNAEAHKILGRNLMIIGRFDAAQLEFEQAIRYKPDSAESHYNLGKLFSIQDTWEPARKAFEAALRIDPSYVEAIDGLGFALEALGDDAGAVASYEKAASLNAQRKGTFAAPDVNLSAYYNRTDNPERALEHARKAIAIDGKSDRAWFQKGRAEERSGDLEAAAESLNQAIVLNPRSSSYYYVIAGVFRRLGLMEENRKALEMFKRLEKEAAELDRTRRGMGGPPKDPK